MSVLPQRLLSGYDAFRAGRLAEQSERYRKLAEAGQKPEILLIGCCDSRVAPEIIFDAGPGEMFVLRNVANLVPPYAPDGEYHGTSAALEFAVMGLKVKHIVIMGHGRCGGINAFRNHEGAEPLSPGDFIGKWITLLEPAARRLESSHSDPESDPQTALERAAIRQSIDNLRTFPCISALEKKGRIALHGAWFDIANGTLWALDKESDRFMPMGTPIANGGDLIQ